MSQFFPSITRKLTWINIAFKWILKIVSTLQVISEKLGYPFFSSFFFPVGNWKVRAVILDRGRVFLGWNIFSCYSFRHGGGWARHCWHLVGRGNVRDSLPQQLSSPKCPWCWGWESVVRGVKNVFYCFLQCCESLQLQRIVGDFFS